MKISIVIRALNEENGIGQCLSALTQQTLLPHEVLVVDNRSTDKTVAIAKSFENQLPLKVIDNPVRGYSTGLNLGAEKAIGDVIVYLSADATPTPRWLEELAKTYQETGSVVVQSVDKLPNTQANIVHYVLENESASTNTGPHQITYFNNASTLYDLATLKRYLPFEGQKGGEDTLMAIRYQKDGLRAYINPAAEIIHDKFPTVQEFKSHMRQHGRASRELMLKQPTRPRLYLNAPYWGMKEMLLGATRRDKRFIIVGWYRIWYSSLGFLNF